MNRAILFSTLLFLFLFFIPLISHADFNRYDLQIPVPEDTWLAADLYMPDTATVAMPVVFVQTPYNKNRYRRSGPPLNTEAFAFVIMDWRGKHGSSHAAVPFPKYGEDGAIAVEWIASREWCDGKIGTYGNSALAQVQWLTAKEQPEGLTCIIPINHAVKTRYQKYYHGGVKRTEYVESLGSWAWVPYLVNEHPTHDTFWQFISQITDYTQDITVPVLQITGWWDMTPDESLMTYAALQEVSPDSVRDQHKLLVGPWTHSTVGQLHQGDYDFPSAQGEAAREATLFFNYHLRGEGEDTRAPVRYFELGPDSFQTAETWPPEGVEQFPLFLTDDGLRRVPNGNGADTFPYNPRTPVRTHGGRIMTRHLKAGPARMNWLNQRGDVLMYQTPQLGEDVRVAGYIHTRLFVSTNRTDTDFAVFLVDVSPNGSARLITDGIRRLRFRDGYGLGQDAVPGEIYELDIPMQSMSVTFQRGHKIRLYVTSSNYPRFDRNLNNGGQMYVPGDTLIALNTVHRTSIHQSALWLGLLDPPATSVFDDSQQDVALPTEFSMNAYPNPFNAATTVSMSLPHGAELSINVYNVVGQQIATLADGRFNAGKHTFTFDASDLASGLYFVRATVPGHLDAIQKVMLVR